KAQLPAPEAMLKMMYQDKKAESGKLTFILTEAIGKAFIAKGVNEAKVLAFLKADAVLQGLARP
ncbi:MAG: 3-dehydroquinate synthase, partial [Aestuariivirga sp.]